MQHINARVQQTIRKVEKGEFDSILKKLEGSPLGIYANACAVEGEVVPMPAGYVQSENALEISVTNEKDTDAIQVAWMGWTPPTKCRSGGATAIHHQILPTGPGTAPWSVRCKGHATLQSVGAECKAIHHQI